MGFAVFSNNRRFSETAFENEERFELVVKQSSKLLFGPRSIYLDLKNKVESQQLGGVIPDGFLFDLNDKDDPQFYLVEAELARHDFMKHIFPQITKFFAFYRNSTSRSKLIERLFEFVRGNQSAKKDLEQFLTSTELYKSIKDVVENSQNILLIADDQITEVREIQDTYTETWGKYVKSAVLKEYSDTDKRILILTPSFEELKEVEAISPPQETGQEGESYNESYHFGGREPTSFVGIHQDQGAYDRPGEWNRLQPSALLCLNPQDEELRIPKTKEEQAQDNNHAAL